MAPTSSTGADAMPLHDRRRLEALLDLHARERVMYAEVLELSRAQLAAVRNGRDLTEIRDLLEKKKRLLDMIAGMESRHEGAREVWERHRSRMDADLRTRMQASLGGLGGVIEEILELEAETDRAFLAQADGA